MRPTYAIERAKTYVLPAGTLSRFASGLDWSGILDIETRRGAAWWRCAVAESEARGMLEWDRLSKRWRLTGEGRAHVRDVV